MKYRSRTDIISQVLDAASGGASKTKIMYNAYLSYAQLKEYLLVLVENGLLVYQEAEREYKTTPKGTKFLQGYQRIDALTGPMI
jgi:predicted transcriptional regulator